MGREIYSIRVHPGLWAEGRRVAATLGITFGALVETALVRYLRARDRALCAAALACERTVMLVPPARLELARRRRVQVSVRLHLELFVPAVLHGEQHGVTLPGVVETALVELLERLGVAFVGWRAGVAPLAPVSPWRVPPGAPRRVATGERRGGRQARAPVPRRPRR